MLTIIKVFVYFILFIIVFGTIVSICTAEKELKEEASMTEAERDAKSRKEIIKKQSSPWDGSHRNLERLIKKTMNDPASYEHVETRYGDQGDHILVATTFRGRNGFGGVVTQTMSAKLSLSGDILEVIE